MANKISNETIIAGLGGAAAGAVAGLVGSQLLKPQEGVVAGGLYTFVLIADAPYPASLNFKGRTTLDKTMGASPRQRAYFCTEPLLPGDDLTIMLQVDKQAMLSRYDVAANTWTYWAAIPPNQMQTYKAAHTGNAGEFLALLAYPDDVNAPSVGYDITILGKRMTQQR